MKRRKQTKKTAEVISETIPVRISRKAMATVKELQKMFPDLSQPALIAKAIEEAEPIWRARGTLEVRAV